MKVYSDFYEFSDLTENCWRGAIQTLDTVSENNKKSELMDLLEEVFYDGIELSELNDFLWFDSDYIFECLDISKLKSTEKNFRCLP